MELELHQLELKYERLRIIEPGRQSRLLAALSEQGQRSPVLVVGAGEPFIRPHQLGGAFFQQKPRPLSAGASSYKGRTTNDFPRPARLSATAG